MPAIQALLSDCLKKVVDKVQLKRVNSEQLTSNSLYCNDRKPRTQTAQCMVSTTETLLRAKLIVGETVESAARSVINNVQNMKLCVSTCLS